jgi:hypothetical protein
MTRSGFGGVGIVGTSLVVLFLVAAFGGGRLLDSTAAAQGAAQAPALQVDPMWPKPLPNHWVLGSVTGVAVDAQNHIWVVHRGADSLGGNEKGMMLPRPTSSVCCVAAPFVLEFDQAGTLVSHWGGKGQGFDWPQNPSAITVDAKGNVWIAGAGMTPPPAGGRGRGTTTPPAPPPPSAGAAPATGTPPPAAGAATPPAATPPAGAQPPAGAGRGAAPAAPPAPQDAHVLKFSKTGQFLMQIGKAGQVETSESKTGLNRPAGIAVDTAANEVYVADGYGNRRIVVFDSETGAYKRHWGAYGEAPSDAPVPTFDPAAPPAKQFNDVTCVEISREGLVYVCDRRNNRIQVFQKDGKFVKEAVVSKTTRGATVVTADRGVMESHGAVWDLAFSNDPQQRFVFVANGHDKKVLLLQRDTLTQVGSFGDGGRNPGRFLAVGSVAVDANGNVYTGENLEGKRVQKWLPSRR